MAEILHFSLELKFENYSEIHTKRFQSTITEREISSVFESGKKCEQQYRQLTDINIEKHRKQQKNVIWLRSYIFH